MTRLASNYRAALKNFRSMDSDFDMGRASVADVRRASDMLNAAEIALVSAWFNAQQRPAKRLSYYTDALRRARFVKTALRAA